MIRLAVLDVDGTITDRNRKVVPEILNAIAEVQDSGLIVSLVSGNVIPVMYGIRTLLGVNGPVFGENGGVMLNGNEVELFFSQENPRKFFSYLSGRINISEILTNRWRETSVAFEGNREEIIDEMRNLSPDWRDKIEIVDSTYAWHIMNRGENKAYAVNHLIGMYSLSPEEVLVVGDSDNDYSMYETSARKASIANSTDMIKNRSEFVSAKSHGSGVIDIFRHYGLL